MPKVIQVIESDQVRGNGKDIVLRAVTQYHTLDGVLLAESDPCPHPDKVLVPLAAMDWLMGKGESFEAPANASGSFWWRSEFRRRAGFGSE